MRRDLRRDLNCHDSFANSSMRSVGGLALALVEASSTRAGPGLKTGGPQEWLLLGAFFFGSPNAYNAATTGREPFPNAFQVWLEAAFRRQSATLPQDQATEFLVC